jgi:hypothetical protein
MFPVQQSLRSSSIVWKCNSCMYLLEQIATDVRERGQQETGRDESVCHNTVPRSISPDTSRQGTVVLRTGSGTDRLIFCDQSWIVQQQWRIYICEHSTTQFLKHTLPLTSQGLQMTVLVPFHCITRRYLVPYPYCSTNFYETRKILLLFLHDMINNLTATEKQKNETWFPH